MQIHDAIEPVINKLNLPFWDAAARNELLLPYCTTTQRYFWPPGPVSPYSLETPITWRQAEPGGLLKTAVIFRRSYLKLLDPIMPYAVGIVELDAGPRLQVHIRDLTLAEKKGHGQRVHIFFDGLLPDSRPVPIARAA